MNREVYYLVIAVLLPFCGRFTEVSVQTNSSGEYHYGSYAQLPISAVCLIVAAIAFLQVWRLARERNAKVRSLLPLRYAWFALPAVWLGGWHIDSFGTGTSMTAVRTGIGGPYAWLLFFSAAVALVSVEACFRCARVPSLSPQPNLPVGG